MTSGEVDPAVVTRLAKLDAAAERLRLCGPACRPMITSDAVDGWGERNITAYCKVHGEKTVTFVVKRDAET